MRCQGSFTLLRCFFLRQRNLKLFFTSNYSETVLQMPLKLFALNDFELFYIKCFTSNFLISYIKLFLFLHQMIQNCFYIERILIFYMEFLKLFLHQIILSFFTSNDSRTFHNISSPDPHGGDQPEK